MRRSGWGSAAAFALAIIGCESEGDPGEATAATSPCSPATAPTAKVTYQAVTEDGRYVVVIGDASGSRVFYGTPESMSEGRITRTSDSCAHAVDFSVTGRSFVAVFAPMTCNDNTLSSLSELGVGTGGRAQRTVPLTVLVGVGPQRNAGASLSAVDLDYSCL